MDNGTVGMLFALWQSSICSPGGEKGAHGNAESKRPSDRIG